ncbi:MAG: PorP/SprF family type IX secretion system membrane protein [Flavobacteriales bacterium]|nr:PorP/SprF family type IX secretion system membrane protein [Flavobacteriales bacterium]
MKKLLYIIIAISIFVSTAKAQQLPLSSLYNVNKFQINSAYAGFNNCLEGYLSHRSQWVGINGAPTTNYLSIHSGVGKNMGLGANIVYDKTDIISKFSGGLSYAYRIQLGQEHNLRFGISAGLYQVNINLSNAIVDDVNDEIVLGGNQSSIAFNNDFSLFYNYKKLQIGVSIPQILATNAKFNLSNTEGGFGLKRHIVSYLGYDANISKKLSLQPSVLYKTFNGRQNQIDFNGQITYNKMLFIGAGYRTNAGLLARFGMNIKELFTVAYAYEFSSGDIGSVSSGSHEIMLGIKFCKDKNEKVVEVVPVIEPEFIFKEKEIERPAREEETLEPTPEPILVSEEKIEEPKELDRSVFDLKVEFPLNNTKFSDSFKASLDKIVKVMVENPDLKVEIIGHSCDLGSNKVKENIAKDRANVVKAYLVQKGVNTNNISTKGMSDSQQVVANTSEQNRQQNRRVEFVLK